LKLFGLIVGESECLGVVVDHADEDECEYVTDGGDYINDLNGTFGTVEMVVGNVELVRDKNQMN
jgi:hypothetical protein